MVIYNYIYDNTPVGEREYPIHDPSTNDKNNALYLQLSDIYYKLPIAPLYSKAKLRLTVIHKKAGLPRVTLEDPIAIPAIFPGFNNHSERRVPLRSNNPQDVSLTHVMLESHQGR